MNTTSTLSVRDARRMVDAALAHAERLDVQVTVAVVDGGGRLRAMARTDGASFLTITLATDKAVTAAGLGVATADFGEFAAGMPVLLTGLSGQSEVNLLPGGIPVIVDGAPVGAIGVAGGSNGEDHPVAQAGLAAVAAAPVAG
jgi:glc operon protein GlcG